MAIPRTPRTAARRAMIRIASAAAGVALAAAGATPIPAGGAACSVPLFAYRTGIVVLSAGGHAARVRVQVADTPERQEVGLMCRNSLDPDAGMLFVFPGMTEGAFWMKNTLIPLSIAFINADWHVVRILDMPVAADPTADDASKFPLYDPHRPYRYALEVNEGFFAKHGIAENAEVRFTPQEASGIPR